MPPLETDPLARYHRQRLLPGIGDVGQRRIAESSVLVVGCGALGSAAAEFLARAGVGRLEIVDRDVVELTNLQRQTLYTEEDVHSGRPKAEAARDRLRAIRSDLMVRGWVEHLDSENVRDYLAEVDLVVDGLDNFETRYLLNDACVEAGVPYLYGGAVGTSGLCMTVLPRVEKFAASRTGRARGHLYARESATPCLRCVFPEPPPLAASATCDTAGVLGTATAMIAARQATEAIKLLVGAADTIDRGLWSVDLWRNRFASVAIESAPRSDCPCCGRRDFEFLDSPRQSAATVLCGRHAVQVTPRRRESLDLDAMASKLSSHGTFRREGGLLQGVLTRECDPDSEHEQVIELTVFSDGRAIVRGTTEPEFARGVYARYVGG